MNDQLIYFIESIKTNPKISSFDEASTKQAIILPILQLLGWNTYNVDEVTPEFSVENRRVDYSLRIKNLNEVFIEVKKTGEELENYQEQLLDYSFRLGIELATLTNGITWWFYLPTKKGDWKSRKFYTIDIVQQDSKDIALKFHELLSKSNVQSGEAMQHAESIYKGSLKKKMIEETMPYAWNKIVTEADTLLIDLIAETTEKICGFKPDMEDVKRFIRYHEAKFLISPIQSNEENKPSKTSPNMISPDKKISQDELIPYIIDILRKHGRKARKDEVEKEIYLNFHEIFEQPWYQEKVAGGIPRWQHNLAWAKERAKHKKLIKEPKESGRGFWELKNEAMNKKR